MVIEKYRYRKLLERKLLYRYRYRPKFSRIVEKISIIGINFMIPLIIFFFFYTNWHLIFLILLLILLININNYFYN